MGIENKPHDHLDAPQTPEELKNQEQQATQKKGGKAVEGNGSEFLKASLSIGDNIATDAK